MDETPLVANTFLNQFVTSNGEFPCKDFRPLGWVHFSPKNWWALITSYFLKTFEDHLIERQDFTRLLGQCNMESQQIISIFFVSLNCTTPTVEHSSHPAVSQGWCSMRCIKFQNYQQKRSRMKSIYTQEKRYICQGLNIH